MKTKNSEQLSLHLNNPKKKLWSFGIVIQIIFSILMIFAHNASFAQPGPVAPVVNPATAPTGNADTTPNSSGTSFESLKNLLARSIDKIVGESVTETFKVAAIGIADGLRPIALAIAAALSLAAMLWNVLVAMSRRESALDVIVESVLYATVTSALLLNYTLIINDIVNFGKSVSATIGSPGTVVTNFMEVFIFKFIDVIVQGLANITGSVGGNASTASTGVGGIVGAVLNFVSAPIDMIASLLFMLIAMFFAFTAVIELFGVLLLGPIVIGVAVSVAPLFIAMLATSWTRKWFEQWINFLVNGAMLTALTLVVVKLLTGVVESVMTFGDGNSYSAGSAIFLALVACAAGKTFSQIPQMADGLFPGRTGMKSVGTGNSGASEAKGKPPAPTPGQVPGQTAGQAAAAASSIAASAQFAAAVGPMATAMAAGSKGVAMAQSIAATASAIRGKNPEGPAGVAGMAMRATSEVYKAVAPGIKSVTGAAIGGLKSGFASAAPARPASPGPSGGGTPVGTPVGPSGAGGSGSAGQSRGNAGPQGNPSGGGGATGTGTGTGTSGSTVKTNPTQGNPSGGGGPMATAMAAGSKRAMAQSIAATKINSETSKAGSGSESGSSIRPGASQKNIEDAITAIDPSFFNAGGENSTSKGGSSGDSQKPKGGSSKYNSGGGQNTRK